MTQAQSFDPIWEDKYSRGHAQRYPWDFVVSFVFRYAPKHKARKEVNILEVGCGTASNLWFAAREGFRVAGIDASASAIAYGRKRFLEDGLTGDLRIGDFSELPFENQIFDMVIDRGAIVCTGLSTAEKTIAEIGRVLKKNGVFLFNPYSEHHSGYSAGKKSADNLTVDIAEGTLTGVGQICFYSRRQIDRLFCRGWQICSLQHIEIREELHPHKMIHAEWRIIANKK